MLDCRDHFLHRLDHARLPGRTRGRDQSWRLGSSSWAVAIESDPDRLTRIESRLEKLSRLKRKYGGTVAEVPVRHRPRRFGTTKYGMWNRVWRSFVDALAVRWMQRRALRYRISEELP